MKAIEIIMKKVIFSVLTALCLSSALALLPQQAVTYPYPTTDYSNTGSASETLITNFQKNHGFTKRSTAGTQLDDTANFVLGTQSLKISTVGDSTPVFTRKAGISPPIDFTDKFMKVWIKVNDTQKVKEIRITATSDNFSSYKDYWIHGRGSDTAFLRNNEWNLVTISLTQTSNLGSPNISNINTIQIRVTDKGNGPVAVWFNGLSLFGKNTEGIVTFTFDDGWSTDYTQARPILDKYHFPATTYVITGKIGEPNRMTLDQLKNLQEFNGWDISPHTVTHPNLTVLDEIQIENELRSSKEYLLDNGLIKGADHFAYPHGKFDDPKLKNIIQKYFATARTTQGKIETFPVGDQYRMRVMLITNTTPHSEVSTRVQQAMENGDWLILVFHQIVDSNASASTQYLKSDFEAIVDDIYAKGIKVRTVSQVINSNGSG